MTPSSYPESVQIWEIGADYPTLRENMITVLGMVGGAASLALLVWIVVVEIQRIGA